MAKKGKLTPQQEIFVQEVIRTGNQREAYRTAYPNSRKWKDSSVDTEASRLLNSPKVSPRFKELRERLKKEAEDECIATAKDVLRELAKMAFYDIGDYVEVKGDDLIQTVAIKKDIAPSPRGAIVGIKATQHGVELKMADKLKALELIGRELGMFVVRQEVTSTVTETAVQLYLPDNGRGVKPDGNK